MNLNEILEELSVKQQDTTSLLEDELLEDDLEFSILEDELSEDLDLLEDLNLLEEDDFLEQFPNVPDEVMGKPGLTADEESNLDDAGREKVKKELGASAAVESFGFDPEA